MTEIESLLRDRLSRLADSAPTTVVMPDEIRLRSLATPSPDRRARRWLGVGAAGLLLAGGGGVTLLASNQSVDSSGAASPVEAVSRLAEAIDSEDLLGALGIMAPEEVSAIRFTLDQAATDAKRVGLLADGFKLDGFEGVDVELSDLVLAAESIDDGITVVRATSGTMTGTFDPATFPLGDELNEVAGAELKLTSATTDLSSGAVYLTTVERDGRWFVSLVYSAFEYVRRASDAPLPAKPATTSIGFDTPEAAAEEFYRRLATLDLASALELIAPVEGDAFTRYLQIWLKGAQASLDGQRADGLSFSLGDISFTATGTDDRKILTPIAYRYEGTMSSSALDLYSSGPPFDPDLATLIQASDGELFVIEAGKPIPSTIEGLVAHPNTNESLVNYLYANPDGSINQPIIPPADGAAASLTYEVEFADGCLTAQGSYIEQAAALNGSNPGAHTTCAVNPMLGGGLLLGASLYGFSTVTLTSVVTAQVDGKWYIAPIGTLVGLYLDALHTAGDDALTDFDGAFAMWTFGTQRAWMEAQFNGMQFSGQSAECQAVLIADANDLITGVIENPDRAAIRACSDGPIASTSRPGEVTEATVSVGPVPESTIADPISSAASTNPSSDTTMAENEATAPAGP